MLKTCKNCENQHEGDFCNQCGQMVIETPYRFKHVRQKIAKVLNIERGLLYTAYQLTIRPGITIENYLKGITRRYYNPISYVFLIVTISSLIMSQLNIYEEFQYDFGEALDYTEKQKANMVKFNKFLGKYMNIFTMLMLPFMTFGSYISYRSWFKGKKHNLAEHFVIYSFVFGQTTLLGIILMPITFSFHSGVLSFFIGMFLVTFYFIIITRYLYKFNYFTAFLRSILAYFLGFSFFMIFIFIVTIIIVIVMKVLGINPPSS